MNTELKDCPFCGEKPDFPDGRGTQYEIECNCGKAGVSIQISDCMTIEERLGDEFKNYRYNQKYIDRAQKAAVKQWNTRTSKPTEPSNLEWQEWPCRTHAPMTQEEFKKKYECNFQSEGKYIFTNKVTVIQPFINPRTGIKESIELSGDSCLIEVYKDLYNIK